MTQNDAEFQNFIDKITEIRNQSYEEFVRFKYLVDGVLLAKKTTAEISKQKVLEN